MRFLKKSLFALCLVGALASCKKGTNWDVDVAIPIAKSHLNISNFFGDSLFQADPSGLLHVPLARN
jgi:hypothetical protein